MVAFAADIYGADFQTVSNNTERGQLATFYRSNSDVFASRISTAIQYVKDLDSVDATKVSVFGYCFGGTGVLQYVMGPNGDQDVAAMVSFHGGLSFLPEVPTGLPTKLLVLDGGSDNSAADIMDLEIKLDASAASWEITRYAGIQHAFTVWADRTFSTNCPACHFFLFFPNIRLPILQLATTLGPTCVRGRQQESLCSRPLAWIPQ